MGAYFTRETTSGNMAAVSIRMRAVSQRLLGGPEVLSVVEIDRPSLGPGEALVRVRAASVNPADCKIRSGVVRRFGDPPFTVGLDFSGVVEDLGEDTGEDAGEDAEPVQPGDRVFGCSFPPGGSHAEYVAVPVSRLAAAPERLDDVHAAALPVTALTAWQPLVRVADVQPGQRVLVHAAAGGIGHLAVQIARARGAHVIGTARSTNHDLLHDLGADQLVDYTTTDFASAVSDVDVVVDPISGDYGLRSLPTLRPGGLLIDVRGTGPDRAPIRAEAERRGLRYVEFGFTPSGADLAHITELVDRRALRPIVERTLPFTAAAEAHRLSESGHARGKLVLTP
jgi:NADPH:quinone reductase-like Zn-dependent oxidoreductase